MLHFTVSCILRGNDYKRMNLSPSFKYLITINAKIHIVERTEKVSTHTRCQVKWYHRIRMTLKHKSINEEVTSPQKKNKTE